VLVRVHVRRHAHPEYATVQLLDQSSSNCLPSHLADFLKLDKTVSLIIPAELRPKIDSPILVTRSTDAFHMAWWASVVATATVPTTTDLTFPSDRSPPACDVLVVVVTSAYGARDQLSVLAKLAVRSLCNP
jgi:hypothetical protein